MTALSRRSFLTGAALAASGALLPRALHAAASAPPVIGLQLFTVRNQLAKDYVGTLHRVSALGYRQVEAAGFFGHSAAQVKQIMSGAGLDCLSAHYSLPDLLKSTGAIIDYAHTLGLHYVICASPWSPDPAHLVNYPGGAWQGILHAMTLDDWRWTAAQLNRVGEKMRSAGLKFGYHNHTMGFLRHGNTTGYQIILSETNPSNVTLELDCGWAFAAGQNPAHMLLAHRGRFSMLHIKDMKPAPAGTFPGDRVPTEVGLGVIDWPPIFKAAEQTGIRHYFVEQDVFDEPPYQALAIDFRNANKFAREAYAEL